MPSLLHLDSSLRRSGQSGSASREFTAQFAAAWQKKFPGERIVYRDFGVAPLPHLSSTYIEGSYKEETERTSDEQAAARLAEEAVAELLAVDHILIGAPMYNFTVPSSIKTWVDHIVKAGTTFRFGPHGPEGLVTGKKVCVISPRGGDYSEGSWFATADMVGPWLRNILGFLGMTEVTVINAERMERTATDRSAAFTHVAQEIETTLASW